MTTGRKAIIAGGGIGGLTAGIALRRAGVDVTIYERAPEIHEIGAGIALASNAMKALSYIGLAEEVEARGVPLASSGIKTWRGRTLVRAAVEARGLVSVCVHRADLQQVLMNALGKEHLRLGHELTGFEQHESGVVARFANGMEAEADLLVGADGLRSSVRPALHGPEEPRYAGYTAWRAVVPFETGMETSESWGRGKRFGIVPIGGGRVYWFATKNAPETEADHPDDRKPELSDLFRGWHQPIEALIEATPDKVILRNNIYDRKPLKGPWGRGRVTLLGDAAHPTTPNLGQGACQAMEDAVVLARHLQDTTDVPTALRAYEASRASRTAYISRTSARIGKLAQLENPLACRLRDAVLLAVPSGIQRRQLEKIVRFDIG